MNNDVKQGEQVVDNSTAKLGQAAQYTEEGYARHMLDAYKEKSHDADEIKLYRALKGAISHIDFMRVKIKDKLVEQQIKRDDLEDIILKTAKIGLMGLDPEYSQFEQVEQYLNSILTTYAKEVVCD